MSVADSFYIDDNSISESYDSSKRILNEDRLRHISSNVRFSEYKSYIKETQKNYMTSFKIENQKGSASSSIK